MEEVTNFDSEMTLTPFRHPFSCLKAGPTNSGKSYFTRELLMNEGNIDTKIDDIYYFYAVQQPLFDTMKEKVNFKLGIPSEEFYSSLSP